MSRYAALVRPLLRRQQPQQILRKITPLMSSIITPSSSSPSPQQLSPSMSFSSPSRTFCYYSSASRLAAEAAAAYANEPIPDDIPSNMRLVNSENQLKAYRQKVKDTKKPTIMYFTARWSGTCRYLWPDVKQLCESYPDIQFYKVDIDAVWDYVTPCNEDFYVDGAPTFYFFKDGEAIHSMLGNDLEEIKEQATLICED